jgi:deoxyribodipyrimidine photo-lyase
MASLWIFFSRLVQLYTIQTVFTNHDYEPYAQERDSAVAAMLSKAGVAFSTYKDQVVF